MPRFAMAWAANLSKREGAAPSPAAGALVVARAGADAAATPPRSQGFGGEGIGEMEVDVVGDDEESRWGWCAYS